MTGLRGAGTCLLNPWVFPSQDVIEFDVGSEFSGQGRLAKDLVNYFAPPGARCIHLAISLFDQLALLTTPLLNHLPLLAEPLFGLQSLRTLLLFDLRTAFAFLLFGQFALFALPLFGQPAQRSER
jgi:hypothetical protein